MQGHSGAVPLHSILNILPLLQQIFPGVRGISLRQIKTSSTPAAVYRLALTPAAPPTLIAKIIQPDWPHDPDGPDREAGFYAEIHPRLNFTRPHVYFTGCDPLTRERVILLEDLQGYATRPREHAWTPAEASCFIKTYAKLHTSGSSDEFIRPWLFPITADRLPSPRLLTLADDLISMGVWLPLPSLGRLIEWVLASAPEMSRLPHTILHNDVFPPNIALPDDLSGEAILLDWEMAGWGLPEMDLAFMFLQPFRSAASLDRASVLEAYWRERYNLEGHVPPRNARRARQFFADALWGLYLIPVAHRSIQQPFPAGSPPHQYWQLMRGVLFEWLERLGREDLLRV
jgi:hypothetical protein